MNSKKKIEMIKIELELYPRLYEIIKKMTDFTDYSISEAINQLLMSHDLIHNWWTNEVASKVEERDKRL